jgi:NADH:ubiquinone oxidoreductase subunit 6 (subunit J)
MMIYNILFYCLCGLLILSAIAAVLARNITYSILCVVAIAISSCGLMLLIGVGFFSIFSLIIYSGMMVILLFFVHNFDSTKVIERKWDKKRYLLVSILSLIFLLEILTVIYFLCEENQLPLVMLNKEFSLIGTKALLQNTSFLLFSAYSYSLEVCGVILFVGIVSSLLIMHERNILRKEANQRGK